MPVPVVRGMNVSVVAGVFVPCRTLCWTRFGASRICRRIGRSDAVACVLVPRTSALGTAWYQVTIMTESTLRLSHLA